MQEAGRRSRIGQGDRQYLKVETNEYVRRKEEGTPPPESGTAHRCATVPTLRLTTVGSRSMGPIWTHVPRKGPLSSKKRSSGPRELTGRYRPKADIGKLVRVLKIEGADGLSDAVKFISSNDN